MGRKLETELARSSPVSRPKWLDRLQGKTTEEDLSEKDIKEAEEDIKREPALLKNGWSPKSLAAYYKERDLAGPTGSPRKTRPLRCNGWHNPHRWRK